jgi:hypothetical protein
MLNVVKVAVLAGCVAMLLGHPRLRPLLREMPIRVVVIAWCIAAVYAGLGLHASGDPWDARRFFPPLAALALTVRWVQSRRRPAAVVDGPYVPGRKELRLFGAWTAGLAFWLVEWERGLTATNMVVLSFYSLMFLSAWWSVRRQPDAPAE